MEWRTGKLKGALTLEAVWVMKVELEQRLGLKEVDIAVKLGVGLDGVMVEAGSTTGDGGGGVDD